MIDKPQQRILLFMPSSGSNWLMRCVRWPKYVVEYFLAQPKMRLEMKPFGAHAFGVSSEEALNIVKPYQESLFDEIYQQRWLRDDYLSTKDGYAFARVGWLHQHFTCVALVRHRRITFPGTNCALYIEIYQALGNSLLTHVDQYPNNTRQTIEQLRFAKSDYEFAVGTHLIAECLLVQQCYEYGIPILEYELLLQLSRELLITYLSSHGIHTAIATSKEIVDTRHQDRRWIYKRHNEYFESGVEPFCEKLLAVGQHTFAPYLYYLQ
jgi:hypothetical protein